MPRAICCARIVAFSEKISQNNENDELLEIDPPENGTLETPMSKDDGGGKLVEKFVNGQLSEATLYDADNTIIQFLDQKRLGKLVDKYSNALKMQGIDGDTATKLSDQLIASLIPDVPMSVRDQLIKTLNYQSFMSKSK